MFRLIGLAHKPRVSVIYVSQLTWSTIVLAERTVNIWEPNLFSDSKIYKYSNQRRTNVGPIYILNDPPCKHTGVGQYRACTGPVLACTGMFTGRAVLRCVAYPCRKLSWMFYWRKSSFIHWWFRGGCQTIYSINCEKEKKYTAYA